MMPFYNDATMWGPQGDPNSERPRLKPGDRMADGRTFMGDNPTAVLEAQLQRVLTEMKPLEARRDDLLAKLARLAELEPAEDTAPATPRAKAKRG